MRGQSNACYFDQLGGSAILRYALEHTLGFDGVRDKVNPVGTSVPDPAGNTTIYGGTSLLPTPSGDPHWLDVAGTGAAATLSAGLLEQALLAHVAALPADVRAAPTAVIWLHNEGDANWAGQTQAAWTRAVRYDAGLVRAALGQTAATVPYLFTDVIPAGRPPAAVPRCPGAGGRDGHAALRLWHRPDRRRRRVALGRRLPGWGAGASGRANAIYDDQGMPVWTAAAGVPAGEGARPLTLDGDAADYRIAAVPGGMMLVRDVRPGAGSDLVLQDTTVLGFRDDLRLFEPTGTLSDVARLYRTALARPPDQVSAVAFRDGSTDIGHLAEYMPASPEFITRAGPLDDAAFVRMLYMNGLGRAPEAAGANGWAALLYAGASRGAVLRGVADSMEARINQAPGAGGGLLAEAMRLYGATLGGGALPEQLASAVGFLAGGGTTAALAASVGASAEFAAVHGRQDASAFVDSVYVSALGRPTQGDSGGWVAALDAGAARPQIALAIADSVEGRLYTSAATHLGLVALV